MMASGWAFSTARSLLCGAGAAGAPLGATLARMGARKVFVVSDPGIVRAGLLARGLASIEREGLHVALYDKTEEDPPDHLVLEAAQMAKEHASDTIVGFGGGSSMDVAKLIALLASPKCEQPLSEMYGVGACVGERLRLVQIPTTAGTGSEVTPISILTTGQGQKKGVVSQQLLPDLSLLDGELTSSLPPHVAASTGIDAMAHALEAYTSALKKNPLSDILSLQALRLLTSNIHAACRDSSGEATSAREAMLLGSSLAGMAFANAPVGAAHALAYPLGTQFKVPHGLSVSLMLPHVMRFNAYDPSATKLYSSIADTVLEHIDLAATDDGKARQLIDYFSRLPQELGLPTHLAEVGVSDTDVPSMAAEAMLQTRLLPNNVRHVSRTEALDIYHAAM